jgi:hypothetical protein
MINSVTDMVCTALTVTYRGPEGEPAKAALAQNEKCDTRPTTTKSSKYVRTTKSSGCILSIEGWDAYYV